MNTVYRKINLFNNLSCKSGIVEFVRLHVLLVEMFFLKIAVEALERLDFHDKCKLSVRRVNNALDFMRGCLDYFQRGVGSKGHLPFVGSEFFLGLGCEANEDQEAEDTDSVNHIVL
jgi:hypothetical protein